MATAFVPAQTPEEKADALIAGIRSGEYDGLYRKLVAGLYRTQAEAYASRKVDPRCKQ
jgi:hypothetical protein